MSDASVAPVVDQPNPAVTSFLNKVLQARQKLTSSNPKLWYRGQSDKTWDLLPGLFRPRTARQQEKTAYGEWVRRAELIEKPEQREWHHLFNMQHFGVPTRLLDWTESFAVAVGFSLVFSNYGEKSTPRIFILDPLALNRETTGRNKVFEIPEDETFSYRRTYLN